MSKMIHKRPAPKYKGFSIYNSSVISSTALGSTL